VPVWHEALVELRKQNKVQLVGVIQEQHGDRCRLFAQWKGFDWPILQDKINLLGLRAVPKSIAIDEHGIVRSLNPSPNSIEEFLNQTFAAPDRELSVVDIPDLNQLRDATDTNNATSWRELGDALTTWHDGRRISEAIAAYREAITLNPKDAEAAFSMGVALRRRSENPRGLPGDFQNAVNAWSDALDLDPNHYIYRRRIEQYGPRLAKPYPFYDWVDTARSEIQARGEKPHELKVEPRGAEIARPTRRFVSETQNVEDPDPDGRINRDRNRIRITPVVVPPRVRPGAAVRAHIAFEPRRGSHWNNEAQPVRVWLDPPAGWTLERNLLTLAQPKDPESKEMRTTEVELRAPATFVGEAIITGYALYFVCDDENGTCYFMRGDLKFSVKAKKK
jgi:tetratricopeptide (TPR) repeat protein